MKISIKDIQYLREKTGFGIMDCKQELEKANGDVDQAYQQLEEKGLMIQEKKQERNSEEGIVHAEVFDNIAVILEISTETDFVARSPEFLQGVRDIGRTIAENKVDKLDEKIKAMVMKFRENIQLKKYNVIKGDFPYAYNHGKGKYAVILNIEEDEKNQGISKEIAMQIIATSPKYISKEDVPKEVLEDLKVEIQKDSSLSEKPQDVIDKIISGKINKYYKEKCLLEQSYIKEEKVTVKDFLKGKKIADYYRYEKMEAQNKCSCSTNMFID